MHCMPSPRRYTIDLDLKTGTILFIGRVAHPV
jgi:hypothetical protein